MANEAILVVQYSLPINFIVANATAIDKGDLCKLTSPMTASASDGTADILAGIPAVDKIASDGVTELAIYRDGIFRMYASGSITVGDVVTSIASYPNYVVSNNTAALSGSKSLGVALQTVTNGQQLLVEVGIH